MCTSPHPRGDVEHCSNPHKEGRATSQFGSPGVVLYVVRCTHARVVQRGRPGHLPPVTGLSSSLGVSYARKMRATRTRAPLSAPGLKKGNPIPVAVSLLCIAGRNLYTIYILIEYLKPSRC